MRMIRYIEKEDLKKPVWCVSTVPMGIPCVKIEITIVEILAEYIMDRGKKKKGFLSRFFG